MPAWGSIANAAGMAVSGYASDKKRMRDEALQAIAQQRQVEQDKIINALQVSQTNENDANAFRLRNPEPKVPPVTPNIWAAGKPGEGPVRAADVPGVVGPTPVPEKQPMVWAADPTGKGGPVRTADKPGVQGPGPTTGVLRTPTEAQEKSYVFYNLMKNAAPELERLSLTGKVRPDMITLALRAGPLDFAANRLLNTEEKQYLKAARDMTAGVLRKESGAAIKNDEILNTMQRMIDQSGDDEPLKLAKTKSRNEYMAVMENAATPALRYYEAIKANGAQRIDPAAEAADPGGGGLPLANGATKGAANEAQALWDAAVARHGKAKVEQTYGPRP